MHAPTLHQCHHHTIHAGTHNAILLLPRQQRRRLATPLRASSQQPYADGASGQDSDGRTQHKQSDALGGQQGNAAAAAAGNTKDTPDRTYRRGAQKQRDRRTDRSSKVPVPVVNDSPQQPPPALNYVAGVDEPQLLPGLISFPSSSKSPAGAALQQLVEGTQDPEEREQLLLALEEQYDQQLMAQLQDMPVEDRARLIEAALAPENDIRWWEQQLLTPVMQDQLREDLGPELSELMDLLLGQPPYKPQGSSVNAPEPEAARKPRSRRLRLNQPARELPDKLAYDPNIQWQAPEGESKATLRKRLMRLTADQKARLPELFMKLQQLDRTYDTAGQVVDMYETVQARGRRLKYLQLARRARAKGLALPDPPQTEQDMLLQPVDLAAAVDEWTQEDGDSMDQAGEVSGPLGAVPVQEQGPQGQGQSGQQQGASNGAAGPASQPGQLQRVRQVLAARGHLQDTTEQPAVVAEVAGGVDSSTGSAHQGSSTATIDAGTYAASESEHIPDSSYQEQKASNADLNSSMPVAENVDSVNGQALDSESLRQTALNAGLGADVADLVIRLNALYERYNPQTGTGWEEEGYTGSSEMQCLKRAALTLAGAARITSLEELQDMGLSANELSLHMTSAINDIMALLQMEADAGAQGLPEPAVHACLLYLRTQLLQPEEQPAVKDTDKNGDDTSGQPVMTLPVDRDTTDRLLRIIAASEVWEALHSLAASWGTARKDGNLLAGMLYNMSRLGQGDPAWWGKEYNEMTASEQSMVLRKQLEARIKERESILGPIDGDQRDKQQDPMAGLLSNQWLREAVLVADEERITALASLDSGVLRCLQELQEQNYSDEVLMKWSLHPVVGPRLTAGLPLMDLNTVHPWFQDVLTEAQNYAAEGLDFEWRMLPKGHPLAQQGLARQHRRQGSNRQGSKGNAAGVADLPKRVRSKLSKNSTMMASASGVPGSETSGQ